MPKDPTVQVAIIGVMTTLITTAGVIIAAMVNNRRERSGSSQAGIEATLRERITLRDEQILDLREEKADLRTRLDAALAENEEKTLLIRHLREELANSKPEEAS